MRQNHSPLFLFAITAILLLVAQPGVAQTTAASAVPVNMVVTIEAPHCGAVTGINDANLMVSQGRSRAQVREVVPLQGDRAGLELFILMDDARDTTLGKQLEEVHRFILSQPAATKVGVAYLQTGGPRIAQPLTADHKLAADALHVSLTNLNASASPYTALAELIEKWPASNNRREILMISGGSDPDFEGNNGVTDDPYVDAAIEKAQRAGIIVFTIATSGQDLHLDRDNGFPSPEGSGLSQVRGGRNYLAQVSQETGGEAYYYRASAPISFVPYLEDSSCRLRNQYLVTFLAQPGKKSGMDPVKVRTALPHTQVVSAEKVYVPAATVADLRQ